MSRLFIALLFLAQVFSGYAQQDYFVLIQSENGQPFYARLNNKTYSSSEIGHLIIPQLKDTAYILHIGFPKNIFPEQRFSITLNKKESGFQLKNLGDRGWALYNWQSLELIAAQKADSSQPAAPPPGINAGREDPFSRLMAGVVNDTAVQYSHYVDEAPKKDMEKKGAPLKQEPKPENAPVLTVTKQDPPPVAQKQSAAPPPIQAIRDTGDWTTKPRKGDSAGVNAARPATGVLKLSDQLVEGVEKMVFVASNPDGTNDTVRVIITQETEASHQLETPRKMAGDSMTPPEAVRTEAAQDRKASGTTSGGIAMAASAGDSGRLSRSPGVNTNCRVVASDYDVDKLRVKMMALENEDDRIITAKRMFRIKCFTTRQIKALSEVFPGDEGRYRLLDAAYPFVSDYENYSQLGSLLTAPYYINRFRVMLKQ